MNKHRFYMMAAICAGLAVTDAAFAYLALTQGRYGLVALWAAITIVATGSAITELVLARKAGASERGRVEMYRIGFLGDDVTVTDVCDAADLYERTVKFEEKRGSGDWSRPYALAAVIAYARETKPKEAE